MITLNIDNTHAIIFGNAQLLNTAAQNQLIAHALEAMSWDAHSVDQALGFVGRWDKERLVRALCRTEPQMVEDALKEVVDRS